MDDSIAIPEEPALTLPPAPRAVVRPRGAALWIGRIFTLPHVAVGAGLAIYVVLMVLWALFGVEVSGVITAKTTSRSKGTTYYNVSYVFEAGGHSHAGSEQVSLEQYRHLDHGDDLPVRYFELGPLHYARMSGESTATTALPVVFALFWNVVVLSVIYQQWFLPQLEVWLCRKGSVTAGVVVATRDTRGRRGARIHRVRYAYRDAAGTRREREVVVSSEATWRETRVEQPLTVLLVPGRPQWSIAYEYALNRIDGVD